MATLVVGRMFATPGAFVRPELSRVEDHWLSVGEATVKMPPSNGPLPKPIHYRPPSFAACVSGLRAGSPKASTATLRAQCQKTYESIRSRILTFLITGWWLRQEAAEQGASVSTAEVSKHFEEERRAHYPTAASFRRLQEASRQTVSDLEFSVETRMLSETALRTVQQESAEGNLGTGDDRGLQPQPATKVDREDELPAGLRRQGLPAGGVAALVTLWS